MKPVKDKFETLVRLNQCEGFRLAYLNVEKIKQWSYTRMPLVVQEMKDLNWDLSDDDTWLENTFSHFLLKWNGLYVNVFITDSYKDYELCKKVIATKCFADYRKEFNIDVHLCLLVHRVIFLSYKDFDDIFISLDPSKGWSAIDLSHYDDDENLEEEYEDWQWLQYNVNSDEEWTPAQIAKAYNQVIYKNQLD